MDLKQEVFADIEAATDEDTVIASNTPLAVGDEMASALEHPNAPSGCTLQSAASHGPGGDRHRRTDGRAHRGVRRRLRRDIEKEDVVVRDTAGFATSRLGLALGLEAIRMVEQGVASPADIDEGMEIGYGHPMGPLELTDHVGLDVRLHIAEHLREELGERFKPPQSRAGRSGRATSAKSGEGYYVWEDGERVGMSGEWGDE